MTAAGSDGRQLNPWGPFEVGDLVIDLDDPERGVLRVWAVADVDDYGPEPGSVYLGEPDEGRPWEKPNDLMRVTVPAEVDPTKVRQR